MRSHINVLLTYLTYFNLCLCYVNQGNHVRLHMHFSSRWQDRLVSEITLPKGNYAVMRASPLSVPINLIANESALILSTVQNADICNVWLYNFL